MLAVQLQMEALSHLLPSNTDLMSTHLLDGITQSRVPGLMSSVQTRHELHIPPPWHKPDTVSPNSWWGQEGFIWIPHPEFPSIKHLRAWSPLALRCDTALTLTWPKQYHFQRFCAYKPDGKRLIYSLFLWLFITPGFPISVSHIITVTV